MSNWYSARTSLLYIGEEATYGTPPTLLSINAFRHTSQKLSVNFHNLARSPERHATPDQRTLFRRRTTADFDVKALLYPSGVLNTLPESDIVLRNALGAAASNVILSTTIASGPTTTGGTVASATGLAVGQPIQIGIAAGAFAGLYVRWLTVVAGSVLTWAPALPAAPLVGDTVKGTAGWSFATALPKTLDIAHYPQSPSAGTPARELLGCVINKLTIMFDSNLEPTIQFSGPAKTLAGSEPNFTPQAKPASFTTVGAEGLIPSGLTGYFQLGATRYEIEKMQVDLELAMDVQNTAFGTKTAAAHFRRGVRHCMVKIDAKVSDDLTLWTPSLVASSNSVMLQIGNLNGQIWGVYMPNVVLDAPPAIGDDDEVNDFSFSGEAMAVVGNDALSIATA